MTKNGEQVAEQHRKADNEAPLLARLSRPARAVDNPVSEGVDPARDPLADYFIPEKPIDKARLQQVLQEEDEQLKPFRTMVTAELLNSSIG
jgi:hypothetical protein